MGFPGDQVPRRQPYDPSAPNGQAGDAPWPPPRETPAASPFGQAGDAPWPPPREVPATSEPPRPDRRWDPQSAKPRSRRPLYISIAVVAVIAAVGAGVYLGTRDNRPAATTAAASPTATPKTGPARPAGKFGYAVSRATDPLPLALDEFFKKQKVVTGKRSYLMTVRRADKVCKNAAEGAALQKALKGAKCTQLLRASFQDSTGKIIGTVGLANLKTSAGAKQVASAGAGTERKDYLKPLQAKKGATKSLGAGEALAGAWAHGHYAVMLWFQFQDGHKPTDAEHKRLDQAAGDITDKIIFPPLDTRSLTGGRG